MPLPIFLMPTIAYTNIFQKRILFSSVRFTWHYIHHGGNTCVNLKWRATFCVNGKRLLLAMPVRWTIGNCAGVESKTKQKDYRNARLRAMAIFPYSCSHFRCGQSLWSTLSGSQSLSLRETLSWTASVILCCCYCCCCCAAPRSIFV